ncbi:hypothetical protein SynROS8604_03315 [Synechococcus sp. ROS8604]|nr:hypothetical protein SynROS8604_03315 [Synechococcus sp. ROS8604]
MQSNAKLASGFLRNSFGNKEKQIKKDCQSKSCDIISKRLTIHIASNLELKDTMSEPMTENDHTIFNNAIKLLNKGNLKEVLRIANEEGNAYTRSKLYMALVMRSFKQKKLETILQHYRKDIRE